MGPDACGLHSVRMQKRLAKSLPLVHGLTIPQLLASKRALYGDAVMTTPDGGGGGTGGDGGGEKTFTQAEMAAQAAREKDQGRRQGRQEAEAEAHKKLMRDFGLPEDTKPEDVKARLAEGETARLAGLQETERLKEEKRLAEERATRVEQEREAEREQTKKERHNERVEMLLEKAGVGAGEEFEKDPAKKLAALDRAKKYVGLEVEAGADSDDIRKAIEKVKLDAPGLFGKVEADSGAGGGAGPGDGRPGSTPPAKRTSGQSTKEAGRELAKTLGWKKEEPAKAS